MTTPASILIVDDEPQDCRLLAALLGTKGYVTRTAASGKEALAFIADDPPLLRLKELGDLVERQASDAARSMIESSMDSLVAISPDGMITDANEAMTRVTGVPRERVIGTAFSEYFTDPQKANTIYQLVFEQGMAVDYPLTMRHRDGTLTEVLYNASVYRGVDGTVLGVFAAARDVTTLMKAQVEVAEQHARELDLPAKDLERLAELEAFQLLTVGRELRMIELKKQIEHLRRYPPPGEDEPQ